MKLRNRFEYDFPLDTVLKVTHYDLVYSLEKYRDLMELKDVKLTHFKEHADGRQEAEHSFSAYDEIPGFARALVSPNMLSWKQVSKWNPRDMTFSFEIIPAVFRKSFMCRAVWKYSRKKGKVVRKLEGRLDVKIPVIGPMIEKYIAGRIYEGQRKMNRKFVAQMKEEAAAGVK